MIYSCSMYVAAYICGAFPSGYYVALYKGIPDIRLVGSGNIGATNVGRALGGRFFALVLFLDALKAFLFVRFLFYYSFGEYTIALAVLLLMVGNAYSIFLQGKGGKGVATGVGIVIAISFSLFCMLFGVWLAAFAYTRRVGIASVITYLSVPFVCYLVHMPQAIGSVLAFNALLGIYKHKKNIVEWLVVKETI